MTDHEPEHLASLRHLAETSEGFQSVALKMIDLYCDYDTIADNSLREALAETTSIYASLIVTLDQRYSVAPENRHMIAGLAMQYLSSFYLNYVNNFDTLLAQCDIKERK